MSRDSFATALIDMYESQKNCDVKFTCSDPIDSSGKSTIGAHKLILSIASDVFSAMFYGSMDENNVEIPDIKIKIFKLMLSFIYGKEIEFENIEDAAEFYFAVDKYNCKDALKFISSYMLDEVDSGNGIFIFETTDCFNNTELKNACLKVFEENTTEIITSTTFLNAEPPTVEAIFGLSTLDIDSEMDLIKALQRYIEERLENDPDIVKTLRPAINHIRFLTLNHENLSRDVMNTLILTQGEILGVIASLPPQKDLSKMPLGLSVNTTKRYFNDITVDMIRSLSNVFSSKICNFCAVGTQRSGNHAWWECPSHGTSQDMTTVSIIFEKYKHVSLMEYERTDLKTVYDIYKQWGYIL